MYEPTVVRLADTAYLEFTEQLALLWLRDGVVLAADKLVLVATNVDSWRSAANFGNRGHCCRWASVGTTPHTSCLIAILASKL